MTYLDFLARFVAIPMALLLVAFRKALSRAVLLALLSTLVIVYIATIPWDSAAIRWGIWSFDPSRLVGVRVGADLPVEEASFFGIETLLVTLVFAALRSRRLRAESALGSSGREGGRAP